MSGKVHESVTTMISVTPVGWQRNRVEHEHGLLWQSICMLLRAGAMIFLGFVCFGSSITDCTRQ